MVFYSDIKKWSIDRSSIWNFCSCQCLNPIEAGHRLSNDCSSKHLLSSQELSIKRPPPCYLHAWTSISSVRHAILWRLHRRSRRITKKVHRSDIPRELIMLRFNFFNVTRSCARHVPCLCQVMFRSLWVNVQQICNLMLLNLCNINFCSCNINLITMIHDIVKFTIRAMVVNCCKCVK